MFGVIISLVFVGFELRHSSKVAKIEAYEAYNSEVIQITLKMSGDPKLASLFLKSRRDMNIEDLSDEEYGMLFSYYLAHLHSKSGLFTAIQEGVLSGSFGKPLEQTILFDNDTFRAMWPIQRKEFDEDFVKYFESKSWNTEKSL